MQISVFDYEVVRLLTNDKVLCQDWKNFALSLGLRDEMQELERKYFRYTPIEDISLFMMEKWEAATGAKIPQLLNILHDLGHTKCEDELKLLASEYEKSSKLQPPLDTNTWWTEVKEVNIPANATGFSYESVFEPYFDNSVTSAVLQDPHIQSTSQLNNFDLFLSVLLEKCPKLVQVSLITSFDDRKDKGHIRKFQMESLAGVAVRLWRRTRKAVNLIVTYDQNIRHQQRSLQLDNGWSLQLENGLDFYYSVDQSSEEWTNLETRKCKPTTITGTRE